MHKFSFVFLSALIFLFKANFANAVVCSVCTVAVGAGVGFSRWLGIDDSVTGLWVGGLLVALVSLTIKWMDKKSIKFKSRNAITIILFYLLTIVPLFWTDTMGNPLNTLWGIDKLLLGIIIGSLVFYSFNAWYFKLKEKNGGKAHFPFQRVAMPLSSLVIASLVFFVLTK